MSSDWNFISKNKIKTERIANFNMILEIGYMSGQQWFTIDQYRHIPGSQSIPWNTVLVSVLIDNCTVYSSYVASDQMHIDLKIDDSREPAPSKFALKISYITDDHKPFLPDSTEEGGLMIKLKQCSIDGVSILSVINEHGYYQLDDNTMHMPSTFFGSNGQLCFDFAVPIYRWLHQHRSIILADLHNFYI